MAKFLKPNKVAIITRGRQAGKKVVIIKAFDEGTKSHPFGHALVVGIERAPRRVTRAHTEKQIARRTKIKPFIKRVNYSHFMPTRYNFDHDGLKSIVSLETLDEPSKRKDAKKAISKIFDDQYLSGNNQWFFKKLAF
ncbi:ribosomal 60S subunit protein L27B [Starmerella bacillaris]|uniref:Ribosomal 60S subunit protein L27B n=1 Tax=Starmerella bacillaris TaxID=1247836 RepID=A0AAV5RDX8_STABA|nr:ribosomal 60S subunit protein L27B [Starmerella bacillaris]